MSSIKKQVELELKYSKKNIRRIVFLEINNDVDTKLHFLQARENLIDWIAAPAEYPAKQQRKDCLAEVLVDGLTDMLVDIMVPLLADPAPKRIQAVCGYTVPLLNNVDLAVPDKVTLATEIITNMAESDLVDISFDDWNNAYVTPAFELDEATVAFINQLMYVPPCVIKPLKVKCIHDDGSYTKVDKGCMLGNKRNYATPHIALEPINLYNSQLLELDQEVLKQVETSKKPLDTPEKLQQFEMMATNSKRVYNDIMDYSDNTGQFYFRYAYDSRGRLYTRGYHINLQSTEYKKALINFGEGELVNG